MIYYCAKGCKRPVKFDGLTCPTCFQIGIYLQAAQIEEARASVALDTDSRYCTVAGRECDKYHLVYNMDHDRCPRCGAEKGGEG